PRANRETQGEHPRQSGASVPGDQATVWPHQGALPRAGEEYGARDHPLRAVESLDGATAAVGDDGSIASAVWKMRERWRTKQRTRSETGDPPGLYRLRRYK